MEYFADAFEVALRSILSVVYLFFITRLMGRKQISQLSFFDYVIGISVGSIAAEMATAIDAPYLHGFLSMGLYAVIATIISIATNKSIKLRRFFNGRAYMLIENGKIHEKNLAKVKYDVNDLLSAARYAGYFNIADIEYAIMEYSGKISFMPKANKKNVTLEDLNITGQKECLVANVIIDGKIMTRNLKMTGLDDIWLKKQLEHQKVDKIEDIILATVDCNHELVVYNKTHQLHQETFID
ncbi:DUF421 domain-containing protein [Paludicola sp. MB14-C6]|uniref:DUF421 domain-containing protein n=1 Tax=Paludihabitans sp. MB14-C6 TaxID=3070656 RepID=UPI0027DAD6C5|nr:DUF421 domain-containing protein [Paludicola sp. MB14-C6]WMJ23699.1 DUF421 domain-containing protein [Paludicola sp. MB14-C6]